jgi:hypothetical protein
VITVPALGRNGRLGNQMFQYAALLGIAEQLGVEPTVPPDDQHELGRCFRRLSARRFATSELRRVRHRWVETSLRFDPAVWNLRDNTALWGYFQSQAYFPDRSVLVQEFRFSPESFARAAALVDELRRRTPCVVGVTVRLGDYVGNPEMLALLDTDFYDRALALLTERHGPEALFVVSSDDPATCCSRFAGPSYVHLADHLDSPWDHLAFLTLTDELVASNSSFAWWAGHLGPPERRVITASRWFTEDGTYPEAEREHHPGWEELEVEPVWCGNGPDAAARRAHLKVPPPRRRWSRLAALR